MDEESHASSMENGSILKSPCWDLDIECPVLVCIAGVMEIQHRFLSGSEIRDCILLSMPERMETRSWLKSFVFKGFLFPDVCINWETNWGERIL